MEQSLAQQTFESLAQVDGMIVGLEAGMVTDEQIVEFLTNCSDEDFEYLAEEIDTEFVKDLGEAFGEDMTGLLADDPEEALDELKKKVIRGGKLVVKTIKKMTAGARRKLQISAKKAARSRKGKKLSAATRRKISKSAGKRKSFGLG